MTGVWNEGEISPRGREMATSSGEREERRPGLMTVNRYIFQAQNILLSNIIKVMVCSLFATFIFVPLNLKRMAGLLVQSIRCLTYYMC